MTLNKDEILREERHLEFVMDRLKQTLSSLGQTMMDSEEKIQEFQKFAWDNRASLDPTEMKSIRSGEMVEVGLLMLDAAHFKKLYKVQNSPFFASIIFENEEGEVFDIYIGLTYLKGEGQNNIIYDWRSPICSLFYDYELGNCSYLAPEGLISGDLKRKRQYKIANGKLVRVFDNAINIDDDLLQEVLASESSEKMKNIVNTIQQEQNNIIRNLKDKTLIVQGIAGSGKTSVALHRIAFLLYRIENLNSNNVLIFSPNQIFTEYISNVLPELGEENALQTTFHNYLENDIREYKKIESFVDFISRYYTYQEKNVELVKYKQSDEIIEHINNYLDWFTNKCRFNNGFLENHVYEYTKEELNELLRYKYNNLPLFERINSMANYLSESNYRGSHKKTPTYRRLLMENANFKKDFVKIYEGFFKSDFCPFHLSEEEIQSFTHVKELKYEDALLFVYIKGMLEGFKENFSILQIVVDEAQDYSKLQYLVISKIFKRASFTILGDINQTINPYYKYDNLNILSEIFSKSKYLELNKTYRSSYEIIEYTNSILNLTFASAIRKGISIPVIVRDDYFDLKHSLLEDIVYLQKKYKSIAIITKDDNEADKLFKLITKNTDATLIDNKCEEFKKELIVIPAYLAKGLEFDSVLVYEDKMNKFKNDEKNLLYVACTRAQHELIVYK